MHSLTGVYALDALDDAERASFEEHLSRCAACRAEVEELTATASLLAGGASAPAPLGLRAAVLEAVGQVSQLPAMPAVVGLDERRARRWYQQPASVAAALLLVVSVGLGAVAVDANGRADRAEQRASRVAAVATDPTRVERNVPVSSGGYGTVVTAEGSSLFRTTDITRLPADRVYQLWILRGDSAESVGVLGRGGELEAFVEGVRPADALGLTVEPAAGSTSPTGSLVLRVRVA